MSAYEQYKAELEKLRQLAAAGRDFTPDGELAWGRQLIRTKNAYQDMAYEERKEKKVWS
jgi:hypothetical protein